MAEAPVQGQFGPVLPRHIIFLLSLAMIWGTSFLVMKIGVQHIPALPLTAIRLIAAALAMVLACFFLQSHYPVGTKSWIYCFALAFFGNSLPFFLITWGMGEGAATRGDGEEYQEGRRGTGDVS